MTLPQQPFHSTAVQRLDIAVPIFKHTVFTIEYSILNIALIDCLMYQVVNVGSEDLADIINLDPRIVYRYLPQPLLNQISQQPSYYKA